jgi:dephospho-CoA kinase
VGNRLRAEHGPDYLARLALEAGKRPLAVSGLRNPAEVQSILDAGGVIVALDANLDTRYRRAIERGRISDGVSFEAFTQQQEKEEANPDPNAQQLREVLAMAQIRLMNDGSIEELHSQVRAFMDPLSTQ